MLRFALQAQAGGENFLIAAEDATGGGVIAMINDHPFQVPSSCLPNRNFGSDERGRDFGSDERGRDFGSDEKGRDFGADERGRDFGSDERGRDFGSDERGRDFGSDEKGRDFGSDERGRDFGSDEKGRDFGGDRTKYRCVLSEEQDGFLLLGTLGHERITVTNATISRENNFVYVRFD